MPRKSSGKPRGRPSLPGSAKVIRLRESVFQLWKERKISMGFSECTDSAFAEILLHSSPEERQRKVSRVEVASPVQTSPSTSTNSLDFTPGDNGNDKSPKGAPSCQIGEQQPVMSTPVRAGTSVARHLEQFLAEKSDSFVDVTGSTKLEVSQVDVPQFTRSWLLPNPRDNDSEDDSEASEACDSDDSCEVIYDGDTHHPGLEETMKALLDELNKSDSDSADDGCDSFDRFYEDGDFDQLLESVSMDISIEDDERTLTMIDPDFGETLVDNVETTHSPAVSENITESLAVSKIITESPAVSEEISETHQQPAPEPEGTNEETPKNSSSRAEGNKDEILNLLQQSFADLTSVADLQSFLFLYSRVRVMVSVEKLLELNGDRCVATSGIEGAEKLCGEKLSYCVNSCGSRVEIVWKCNQGHHKRWESSEVLAVKRSTKMYLNDSLQAAAIIISGNNYEKFSLLAKALNLNLISKSTFLRFQKHCGEPVVREIWTKMNGLILEILKHYDEICLCGDGRSDSPGHSARYCVYSLMEHASHAIVDFEVLDSRETGGNSVNMEREGLRRLLERMAHSMPFSELATDASTTIMKLVRETKEKFPQLMELFHSLDIWHKAKKLTKCLHQAAKMKGCEAIKPWIEDIVNHFWYCCQTCNRDVEELKDAWFGVLHHVCGEHSWAGGQCKHDPDAVANQSKTYLQKSSKAMAALRAVVLDKKWMSHFAFYVRFRHTSDLENFNSMLTKYAPKRSSFEYPFFIMRIMLAAIDHNMHLFRGTKTKSDGTECGHRKYSKRTKNYHAQPVKQEKEYSYFPFMMARMLKERCKFEGSFTQRTDDNVFNPKQIAPTLGMKEAPPTEELMKGPSRFVKHK